MSKIIAIALNDLRRIFMEGDIWLNILVIPIGLSVVIGLAMGSPSTEQRVIVDIHDHDTSTLSAALVDDMGAINDSLILCPADSENCQLGDAAFDDALALERLEAGISAALIEIPEGYAESVMAGENVTLTYRSNEDAVTPSAVLQSLQAAVQRQGAALVAAEVGLNAAESFAPLQFDDDADRTAFRESIYNRADALWTDNPVTVNYIVADPTGGAPSEEAANGFNQSIPGMGSMYVMFAVLAAVMSMLAERANWTIQRLIMMPVTRGQVLLGKMTARFAIGMVQYFILFGVGGFLGVNFGTDMLALVLVMAAFTLCMTALAFALATVIRTLGQAESVTLFIALTLAPLGGAWWPLEIVPEIMRTIGHISPVAWAMDAFHALMWYNGSLADVLLPIGVLLAMSAVFFIFAVWRFRYE